MKGGTHKHTQRSISYANNFNYMHWFLRLTITGPFISSLWIQIVRSLSHSMACNFSASFILGLFRFDVEYFFWIFVHSSYSYYSQNRHQQLRTKKGKREWTIAFASERSQMTEYLEYDTYRTNPSRCIMLCSEVLFLDLKNFNSVNKWTNYQNS